MNNKFKIIIEIKNFAFNLDDILCRLPNREKVLKDKFRVLIYEIIELVYKSNYLYNDKWNEERIIIQANVLSKISMLDFLLEESYRKGYLSESVFKNKTNSLTELNKMIKGWISYERSYNKRST